MRTLLVAGMLCVLPGCAQSHRDVGQVPPGGSARPSLSARLLRAETTVKSAAPAQPGPDAWLDAMRASDFAEAARLIDSLPEARRGEPGIRFSRARAALAQKDFARAKTLLEGLESALPVLAEPIRAARAEAEAAVGPYEDAARYFVARGDPESLLQAALAWERAAQPEKARGAADRAVRALGNADRRGEARCRIDAIFARARAAQAARDAAAAATDYRLLAVEAPATEAGDRAMSELARTTPPGRLTAEQRLTRAKNLASAGKVERALAEIDEAARDTAAKLPPVALAHARGFAYYLSRSDYSAAAAELTRASGLGGAESVKDAFYAARALSRAQDDAGAIQRYDALAKAHPESPFAEEARYQSARLHLLLSQWDAAIAGHRAYLDAFDKKHKARFAEAARYELALALLASGKGAEAAPLFSALAAKETDPLDRASLRELEGAALAEAGEKEHAAERLLSVIRDRPLSYPALVSAARLEQLQFSPPPPLAPAAPPLAAPPPLDVELPERVAALSRLGLVLDAERELARHESELTARYAPRGSEALCEAYGAIGAGAERYRVARAAVKGDVLDHEPTDATRWAWECLYPRPFGGAVASVETAQALPVGLLYAVMRQESAFRPDALSPTNAVGLLQLMPDTAEHAAKDLGGPFDPSALECPGPNVRLGGYYLRRVFDRFGGSVALAAAAYNAGPKAVSRWLETGETLPLDVFVAKIPFSETRGYVARVIGNLARYAYLQGGSRLIASVPLELPQGRRFQDGDY